ncbi:hypothetical protein L9F63_000497, partial [Diploptera punctata]
AQNGRGRALFISIQALIGLREEQLMRRVSLKAYVVRHNIMCCAGRLASLFRPPLSSALSCAFLTFAVRTFDLPVVDRLYRIRIWLSVLNCSNRDHEKCEHLCQPLFYIYTATRDSGLFRLGLGRPVDLFYTRLLTSYYVISRRLLRDFFGFIAHQVIQLQITLCHLSGLCTRRD